MDVFGIYRKSKNSLPGKFLVQDFVKIPFFMLKIRLSTFILSKSYIVMMKCSIKLVFHWVMEIESIATIISKRYFVSSDKFLIALKISYHQAILTKRDVITKLMQTSRSACCIFGTVYCSLQEVSTTKYKTKATLKHSSLKRAMTSFFCKPLL